MSGAEAQPARRRGLLDSLAPRPTTGVAPPGLLSSLGHGIVVAASTPILVVGSFALVFVIWVILLVAGYEGPFSTLVSSLAVPPIGTGFFDLPLPVQLFGQERGFIIGLLALLPVRAVVIAAVAAIARDALRSGRAGWWSVVAGARAIPATLAASFLGFMLFYVAGYASAFLGPSFGLLLQVAGPVFALYALGYVPAVALSEPGRVAQVLRRSWQLARVPQVGNLSMAFFVVFPAIVLGALRVPGSEIGVNPSVAAWAIVLVGAILHVAVEAAYVDRYLRLAPQVPAEPAPEPARRGSGARGQAQKRPSGTGSGSSRQGGKRRSKRRRR